MSRCILLCAVFLSLPYAAGASSAELSLQLDPPRFRPLYQGVRQVAAAPAPSSNGYYVAISDDSGPLGVAADSDGAPVFPNPIHFQHWVQDPAIPTVAPAADKVVIAWHDQMQVFVRLQDYDSWIHPSHQVVGAGTGEGPAAATGGDLALLVWSNGSSVLATTIDPALWPSVPAAQTVFTDSSPASLVKVAYASSHDVFLVAWKAGTSIHARLTDDQGTPFGSLITFPAVSIEAMSVSWDGSNFVVVWSGTNSVRATRISVDGFVLDVQPISIATGRGAQSGSLDGMSLISWIEGGVNPYSVRATRFSPDGQVLDPWPGIVIAQGLGPILNDYHRVASVVGDGSQFLVVWLQHYFDCIGFQTHEDVMAVPIDPVNPPVLSAAQSLFSSAPQYGITSSVLGDGYWTAWFGTDRQDHEILGARRGADGQLLDPAGMQLEVTYSCFEQGRSTRFGSPEAAGHEDAVLTAWRSHEQNLTDIDRVEYRLHAASGISLGANTFYFVEPQDDSYLHARPVVTTDGTRFLLAFTFPGEAGPSVANWVGITAQNVLTSEETADLGSDETLEDTASNGDGFLLAWTAAGANRDAFVGRLDANLTLLDSTGIAIATSPGDDGPVRVASDGSRYLAVWGEGKTLRGARLSADGTILDPVSLSIAARSLPFDLSFDGHHYVLAYVAHDGTDELVMVRRIASDGTMPDASPTEVLRRPDRLKTCSIASHDDGSSLIALTTSRETGWGYMGYSGHGVIYSNPAVAALDPEPAPPLPAIGAHPNPFISATTFFLGDRIGMPGVVRIHDAGGRLVRTIAAPHGLRKRLEWDGRGQGGAALPAGAYFYRVDVSGLSPVTGKLVKLR